VGVENVYQYEPNTVGNCTNPSGCVGLISSGTSEKESAFLDATLTGDNAFYLTAAPILPQDQDTAFDIYDARVCTEASPCIAPTPPPKAPCEETEACRGGSTTTPTFQPPPSSTFSGPGNTLHPVPKAATLPEKSTKAALTNAQKLTLALKSCRKLPKKTHAQKVKRARCEAQAKKKYGTKKAKHSSKRTYGRAR
jgi:hypothetical protein